MSVLAAGVCGFWAGLTYGVQPDVPVGAWSWGPSHTQSRRHTQDWSGSYGGCMIPRIEAPLHAAPLCDGLGDATWRHLVPWLLVDSGELRNGKIGIMLEKDI